MLQPQDLKQLDDFLTTAKFAELIEVSPRTVERWIQERRVDSVKISGAIRIPKVEYLRLLSTNYRTRSL